MFVLLLAGHANCAQPQAEKSTVTYQVVVNQAYAKNGNCSSTNARVNVLNRGPFGVLIIG